VRSGPQIRRSAHVSRYAYGAPSPLERLAILAPAAGQPSAFFRRTRDHARVPEPPAWEPQSIQLGSRLPINLRYFLAEQLGPSMRVDEDTITALEPRSGDSLMRELARAIRRFSAERAREAWSECTVGLRKLEAEMAGASADCHSGATPVLCLRCACVATDSSDRHSGSDCLAISLDLDFGVAAEAEARAGRVRAEAITPDALHRAVEGFRRMRTAAGLPHYDLDCYAAGGQAIFTWRPLPPVA
jgi:hypothetical protein